jgi:hypothetical protein
MNASNSRRRWLWYGLGGTLAFIVATAVGLMISYRSWKTQQQAQQRAATSAVEALGGEPQPSLSSSSPLAALLESGEAPNLIFLDGKNITDDDLAILQSAPATRALHLVGNQITDDGLAHLSNLSALEFLDLRRNRITDAGLVHLENLRNLNQLNLIGTQVTPVGVAKLQQKLPNAKIAH